MLPMGANLDHDPGFDLSARSSLSQLSLLFIGGDWERKGGPLLIEIFRMLQSRDPGVELNIVGCRPSLEAGLHGVKVHGVLRKSDRDDARLLDSLFRRSAFLAVPSRQEAYGLVYCEACAHGVPPIAAETGGVGSIIVDGVNGLLFSLDDLPKAYVNRILEVWSDRDRYLRMSSCARTHYENRLSWNAWARGISSFAEDCLGDARRADA
jgi:glycosyltransferase involved in cell wall biosynthesis